MPNVIKIKKSGTPDATPTLENGELATNWADGKLYVGNATSITDAVKNVASSFTVHGTNPVLTVGNSTVNSTVNSTTFSQTANNATNFNGGARSLFAELASSQTFAGNNTLAGTNTVISSNIYSSGASLTHGLLAGSGAFVRVGNSTVNTVINSTTFTGTANNASFIGGIGAANSNIRTINFIIDGGGATIAAGIKGDIQVDFAGTINSWTMLADASGNATVEIWKTTYAGYAPVVADKITASAPVQISSVNKQTNSDLTGWTTTFSAGDIFRFNVNTTPACTVSRITIALKTTVTS